MTNADAETFKREHGLGGTHCADRDDSTEKPDTTYDAAYDRAALRAQTEHETANAIADWLAASGMPGAADAVREGRYRPMGPYKSEAPSPSIPPVAPDLGMFLFAPADLYRDDVRTSHDKIGARLDDVLSRLSVKDRPLDLILDRLDSIVNGLADVEQQISNIGR